MAGPAGVSVDIRPRQFTDNRVGLAFFGSRGWLRRFGGGSGGSFLLQSAAALMMAGAIDTGGGDGSRTGGITTVSINALSQAGAGAPGFYRLESAGSQSFTGTGVPAYNASTNAGPLTDSDDHTGSRSIWLRPPTLDLTTALPTFSG